MLSAPSRGQELSPKRPTSIIPEALRLNIFCEGSGGSGFMGIGDGQAWPAQVFAQACCLLIVLAFPDVADHVCHWIEIVEQLVVLTQFLQLVELLTFCV